MIIINILLLSIFTGFYLASLRRQTEGEEKPDKREHRLYFLYPMAELILSVAGVYRYLQPKYEITNAIKALRITSKPEQHRKFYLYNKVSLVVVVLSLFSLFSIIGQISKPVVNQLRDGRYIERPEQGEGNKEVELNVTLQDSDNTSSNYDSAFKRRINLAVGERSYTPEEVTQLFEDGKEYLLEYVLGENDKADAIHEKLAFCDYILDTGIAVEWKPEDVKLITGDGTINNERLLNPVQTTVTAVLSYEELKTTLCLTFTIIPRVLGEEDQLNKRLTEELILAQENSRRERELILPEQLEHYHLHWSEEKEAEGYEVLIYGILIAILLWYAKDMELKQQLKLRQEQLLMDYPELIHKFTLLINAGMTIRQAWCKVAEDYQTKQFKGNAKLHYAYEEMLTTVHELKLGMSENYVYEQYGRRIGLMPYIRLSSLLSQNRRKGNKGFTDLLRQEALEAFEDRKEMAKRLGEEAGTKLLAPMMFLLLIVFLIILIPAFMAFQI